VYETLMNFGFGLVSHPKVTPSAHANIPKFKKNLRNTVSPKHFGRGY
jgi:hypothetical protein